MAALSTATVGVIGAGISAACCVRTLAAAGVTSCIYEQGRGAGGRLATRGSRSSLFQVNHGAPAFTARSPEFAALLTELQAEGAAERWDGVSLGSLDAATGVSRRVDVPGLVLWRGEGAAADLCDHIVRAAQSEVRYGTQVAGLGWDGDRWELRGRDGEVVGRHRRLVVSGSTMGHPRWRSIYGTEPPLASVRDAWGDAHPGLDAALSAIGAVESRPVLTVLAGWEAAAGAGGDDALLLDRLLEFDLLHVEGHPVVRKVARHRGPWGLSVAVHTTHEFAASCAGVHGHKSAVAQHVAPPRDPGAEARLRDEVWSAFEELLQLSPSGGGGGAAPPPPAPVWGPFLHRWGSAFSDARVALGEHACVPEMGLAFCGDFVAPVDDAATCHVEVAALSGIEAGRRMLAAAHAPSSKV